MALLAGPWSESVLESRARLWFLAQGLPQPDQQRWIAPLQGGSVARVDFLWERERTICEMDGKVKYDDVPPDGEPRPATRGVVWEEKRREDGLRDLGLEVVRGYWDDEVDDGTALAGRVRRAFARGLRNRDDPAYRVIRPKLSPNRPLAVGS